jgi:hypothetical protein
MASSALASSSTVSFVLPNCNQLAQVKLEGPSNYIQWLSIFLPILRSNELMGIIDGTEPCPPKMLTNEQGQATPNPEYSIWTKKDQHLLSWINASLSEKVLCTVYGLDTSKQVWAALANRFANQSCPHISNIKQQLQNLRQGSKSCSDYLQVAKSLADQLSVMGKPLDDEDLISSITNGLNPNFINFVTNFAFATREKSLSFDVFQDMLLNHEMLLNNHQVAAPNVSTFALFAHKASPRNFHQKPKGTQQFHRQQPRGYHYPKPNGYPAFRAQQQQSSHSLGGPRFSNPTTRFSNSKSLQQHQPHTNTPHFLNTTQAPCQICGKSSHQALDCFHRMNYSFQGKHPPLQLAAMAAQSNAFYDEDQEWLVDSGANAHITNDLEKLTIQQPFEGNEMVAVGNGAGLKIDNSCAILLHNPSASSKFHLKNVLHCPNASANLLSIQKFCSDNDCHFILTSTHFFVKDNLTKATLLEGRSENGLYPLRFKGHSHKSSRAFVALLGIRISALIWHFRLGHSANDVVSRVVKAFNLPVSSLNINKINLCDSCQLGKSKKQPFSSSTRQTVLPLNLIHTDV